MNLGNSHLMFPFFLMSIGPMSHVHCEAYSPLQRETTHLGGSRWFRPPTRRFRVAYTNMLVSKKPCRPNATPQASEQCPVHVNNARCEPLMPNANQWNIVRVGYTRVGFVLGMYISCCLCQFNLREPVFCVEYGLKKLPCRI